MSDDSIATDSGRVPRSVECELTNDLVDSVVPGDVVSVTGVVKVLSAEQEKTNSQLYFLYIDANSISKAGASSNLILFL